MHNNKQREEKIEELQAEAERVIGIIHPVHQKVHEVAASIESNMLEHVSSDLVEHMQKIEEEVWIETEKLVKIMEYFHTKVNASHSMEK